MHVNALPIPAPAHPAHPARPPARPPAPTHPPTPPPAPPLACTHPLTHPATHPLARPPTQHRLATTTPPPRARWTLGSCASTSPATPGRACCSTHKCCTCEQAELQRAVFWLPAFLPLPAGRAWGMSRGARVACASSAMPCLHAWHGRHELTDAPASMRGTGGMSAWPPQPPCRPGPSFPSWLPCGFPAASCRSCTMQAHPSSAAQTA